MRTIKALLFASLLVTGPAFAGQDSTVQGSVENSPPEMQSSVSTLELSDAYAMTEQENALVYSEIPG
jgi:hypothetical protein